MDQDERPYTDAEVLRALKEIGRPATEEEIGMTAAVIRALDELVDEGVAERIIRDGQTYYGRARKQTSPCDECLQDGTSVCGTDKFPVIQWAFRGGPK